MKARECPNEHEVVAATRRGALDGPLKAHANACRACSESARVTAALVSLADGDIPARSPVDPRLLWLKAQLVPGSFDRVVGGAASRGVIAVWGVVAASWAILLAWRWSDLRRLFELLTPERLLTSSANPATVPVASLAVVMLMVAVTLGIMLHQVFVEEL
ncbi:MAG: hypothetical protein HYU52_12970 [Acidobacteria bacterium]|nr:hypothetical protein [Acidobacteriota bacterium]